MESFNFINEDEAIALLQDLKSTYAINSIMIHFVDFDTGETNQSRKSIEEGCNIIRKAKTITYNDDDYVPHLMAFSKKGNWKNIPNTGKMHDLFLYTGRKRTNVHRRH